MIYLAALGMVLAVAVAVGFLAFAFVVRPERARHAAELEAVRRQRAEDVARVAAEQMRARGWLPAVRDAGTVRS